MSSHKTSRGVRFTAKIGLSIVHVVERRSQCQNQEWRGEMECAATWVGFPELKKINVTVGTAIKVLSGPPLFTYTFLPWTAFLP